ncbi:MAG: RluA family pseudouridine synthase [Pirellulales bacterium]|nr:RluA family pseudouridine synthase [Pirellulales bacterium]
MMYDPGQPDPVPPELDVLYEEGPCLVVNKPPGVLTQAPPGIDSLEVRARAFLRARESIEGNFYLALPHRLDRPVSGAILLARHARAARRLAEQFEDRTVTKIYWACVSGRVDPAEGVWENHIRKIPDQALAEIVPPDHPESRPARLTYRTLAQAAWGAWLEIRLDTGRMHQIRVQAAHRGHPILGDAAYGSAVPFGPAHDDPRLGAIALHARWLTFAHPMTRQSITVPAPLPDAWKPLGLTVP